MLVQRRGAWAISELEIADIAGEEAAAFLVDIRRMFSSTRSGLERSFPIALFSKPVFTRGNARTDRRRKLDNCAKLIVGLYGGRLYGFGL